jgi:hypothetical protein
VSVTARPLWRIRLARELRRYLFYALAGSGLLASARFAVDPPRPVLKRVLAQGPVPQDLGAEGFASLFARRYLTWEARDPEALQRSLAGFVGTSSGTDAGLHPPGVGAEHVQWTEVVQQREPRAGLHVYTVAVQTDSAGLLYLTVSVTRNAMGALVLAGYPAFVGAPASSAAGLESDESSEEGYSRDVSDPTLVTVVQRALRNYLAGSASELAADLSSSAHVSLPGLKLTARSFQSPRWIPGGGSVRTIVLAEDGRGAQYTLDYELDVTRQGGRWEISAIQMEPDT